MKHLDLALVQGITEAFPISSSAHLSLFSGGQKMAPGLDAILHLGSFFALCLYFHKDILKMCVGLTHAFQRKPSPARHLFYSMVLTTLPCGLMGLAMHKASLRPASPFVMAFSMCFFGGALYTVDRLQDKKMDVSPDAIPLRHAITLGMFQVLSLVPGVSRLGICLIAGRLLGYRIACAARIGFLMGIPVMASASLLHIPLFLNQSTTPLSLVQLSGVTMLINLPMIHLFLYWTRHFSIAPLALYRVILGLFLLWK